MSPRAALSPRPTASLRLTPAMRQGLSVLQMNIPDLVAELRRAGTENPLIRVEEPGAGEAGGGWGGAAAIAAPETLADRLRQQIAVMSLEPRVAAIATFLIGDIGEDGYLDPEAMATAAALGAMPEDVARAVEALQSCEPAGVGACSLEECLALQMREKGIDEAIARTVCAHLDLLAEHRFADLSRRTQLPRTILERLAALLPSLNPRPGEDLSALPLPALPDIIVEQGPDGLFHAALDESALPRVALDTALADRMSGHEAARSAREHAQGLFRALQFRERTLTAVAALIVTHQHRFFADGPEHLVPMTRIDMARALDLHPSTIGRALAGKALSFRGAVHPLSLFGSPPRIAGENGGVTAYAVQRRIRQMIEAERPGQVLSDEQIAATLRREGVDIARRTVAKYRRCLTIPSSFERKRQKGGRGEERREHR